MDLLLLSFTKLILVEEKFILLLLGIIIVLFFLLIYGGLEDFVGKSGHTSVFFCSLDKAYVMSRFGSEKAPTFTLGFLKY